MSTGNYNQDVVSAMMTDPEFRFHRVPPTGENVFLCPRWSTEVVKPCHEVKVHYNIDKGGVICLQEYGQLCPICMANSELRNDKNNPFASELSKEIYAKTQVLWNLIAGVDVFMVGNQPTIMSTGKEEPKVEVYKMGKECFNVVKSFYSYYQNINDPNAGNVVILNRQPNAKEPKYAKIFPTINPAKAVLDPRLMALMSKLNNLQTYFTPEPAEKLKQLVDAKLAAYRASRSVASAPVAIPQMPQPPMPQMPQTRNPVPSVPNLVPVTYTAGLPATPPMTQGTNPFATISPSPMPVPQQQIPLVAQVPAPQVVPQPTPVPQQQTYQQQTYQPQQVQPQPIIPQVPVATTGNVRTLEDFQAMLDAQKK